MVYVAQHEGGESETALRCGGRVLGGAVVEVHQAGAILVGRHAQVAAIAKIGADLDGVVANDLGPVVDNLELVFALGQRAVAAVDAQAGAISRVAVGSAAAARQVGD